MRNNRRFAIYIMLFLFLCIYSLDRVTMGVAGSSVAKELHIGPVALGYLFSSYLWLYAVLLLPVGAMTDRVGTHRMSALAAGFWSLSQALGGAATSLAFLLCTRLGLGVFESAANPCAHRALREWAPRRERGLATAIWYSGTTAGPAATVVLTISLTFNTFAQSMNFALTNDRLRSTGDVGRAYAFFTLGGISFGIAGPIVTGYLVAFTGDFKVALVLCGGLSLAAAILVTSLTRQPMGERAASGVAVAGAV